MIDASGGRTEVDRVVIATHPDQALTLLADPVPLEAPLLGSFRYATNEAVLHRDPSLLPTASGAKKRRGTTSSRATAMGRHWSPTG